VINPRVPLIVAVLALGLSGSSGPCAKHVVAPGYPRIAWTARIQGDVRVALRIGADGRILQARATSGPPILRPVAEENARRWRFAPGHETELTIVYEFRLHKPDFPSQPPPDVQFDLPGRVVIDSSGPAPILGRSRGGIVGRTGEAADR
jgi:Gram-negative bacterial TonB protein C-terminal